MRRSGATGGPGGRGGRRRRAPTGPRPRALRSSRTRTYSGQPPVVGPQRVRLDRDGPGADRVEQRAVVGDEQQRALEALQRVLERLAALEVEVVGRLVEDQDVGARLETRIASDSRLRSPPLRPSSGFSASSPLNRKRPEQRARLVGRQAGALAGRPRATVRGASALELLAVLGEVADLDVVARCAACRRRARARRRAPRSASSCRCRWRRRARRARRARATARRRASSTLPGTSTRPVLELEDHAAGALGRA